MQCTWCSSDDEPLVVHTVTGKILSQAMFINMMTCSVVTRTLYGPLFCVYIRHGTEISKQETVDVFRIACHLTVQYWFIADLWSCVDMTLIMSVHYND